jgi:SAM-dependent methyltransferase
LCLGCKSLERHRAGRALMEIIRDRELFKQCSLLQFGEPGIVAKGWFRSVESGAPVKPGPLDPSAIALADGSVDCLVSCDVITKLPDHCLAIREIRRVLSPRGLAYLSFPNPGTLAISADWGFADPKQNGNFRILGRDFEDELAKLAKGMHATAVQAVDPVTEDKVLVYLLMKEFFWMRQIVAKKVSARFLEVAED